MPEPVSVEVPIRAVRVGDILMETRSGNRWYPINSGNYYRVTEVIRPGVFCGYATNNPGNVHEWVPQVSRIRIAPRQGENDMALLSRNYAAVSSAIKASLTEAGDSPLVRQGVLATAHAVAHAIESNAVLFDVAAFLTACGVPDNQ